MSIPRPSLLALVALVVACLFTTDARADDAIPVTIVQDMCRGEHPGRVARDDRSGYVP